MASGKRLKNRRKKQKKIEKKVLQQIISNQTILVREFDKKVPVKPSVDLKREQYEEIDEEFEKELLSFQSKLEMQKECSQKRKLKPNLNNQWLS